MRLLQCHIENFGKLHDFRIDFAENPMVIVQKNGWGKSTLAGFIKVMFYGFANEKKRGDALERERVRFKPWQGGVYGGELEFETGGKRYRLNRTFGSRETEDTFALYDCATNLVSNDFTANIGEELFQINRDSFLRTIYIAQDDCATATTDSINAKMGNLADNLDDINNYEKVQQDLKDLKNHLDPRKKTGLLKKRKDEIAELKNNLRKKEFLESSAAELEGRLESCRLEREEALGRLEELRAEWTAANKYNEILAKREHYERILRQCNEKRSAMEAAVKDCGGKMPTADRLQKIGLDRNTMIQMESEKQANALDEAEQRELLETRRRFAEGLPDEEIFEQGRRLSQELEALEAEELRNSLSLEERQELERLQSRVGSAGISERQIDDCLELWNVRMEKKSGLGTKKATLGSLRTLESSAKESQKGRVSLWLFLIPVCLLIAGGLLWRMQPMAGGLLIAAGAAAFIVLTILCIAGGRKQEEPDAGAESGAAVLEREIEEDEAAIRQAYEKVMQFLERLGVSCSGEDRGVRDALYGLKDDVRHWQRLDAKNRDYEAKKYPEKIKRRRERLDELLAAYFSERELREKKVYEMLSDLEKWKKEHVRLEAKEKKYQQASADFGAMQASVKDFLAEHARADEDMDAGLRYLAHRLSVYETDAAELAGFEREREEFERGFSVDSFEDALRDRPRTLEEIEGDQQRLRARMQEIRESLDSYVLQLDDRQRELEELELQQESLTELEARYERELAYYHNLELTGEYLTKAKESFSAKYMGPIMNAFKRYQGLMSGEDGEEFRMDANICVTKREEGEQRDPRAFSAGNQDLIGIALRMALVEAMYRKEKPFLIFDDSFHNMDDEKIGNAKQFLQKVAEDYQIIYFTCHGSRAL